MDSIRLEEYESRLVPDLDAEDLRFLAAKHSRSVATAVEPVSSFPKLTATSWVGVITLPSGRELRIHTKVPVANLFYMLSVAGGWPFRPDDIVGYEPDATILYVVARYFRDLLRELDAAGLYRAYRDGSENLTALRGRIDFREDLRRNLIERQRTACSFSEFTRDIPENQFLRQAASLMGGSGLVGDLESDFHAIDYWWGDVTPTRFDPDRATRFVYHRLNERYRPIHMLAALLMQWLSPGGAEGDRRFPAFLVNMNDLYESFVRRSIELALVRFSATVRKPRELDFDKGGFTHFQPDLLFTASGLSIGVGDCKYKRRGPVAIVDQDLYQMVAYCTALGLTDGVLIYPQHLVNIADDLSISSSDIKVHRLTINLGEPLSELGREAERVATTALSLFAPAVADTVVDDAAARRAATVGPNPARAVARPT